MKYAPSLPPLPSGVEHRLQVTELARVKPVKPVQQRDLPPLVTYRHGAQPVDDAHAERHYGPDGVERRTYCRRTRHEPILIELRSGKDRRQHGGDDEMPHIDEVV